MIALVVLLGVFFLSPPVSASDVSIGKDVIQEDERGGGAGDGKNTMGGEGSDTGDDTDPDWFGFTSWDGTEIVEAKSDPSEDRSFLQFIGWLLLQASNQYLSFWR